MFKKEVFWACMFWKVDPKCLLGSGKTLVFFSKNAFFDSSPHNRIFKFGCGMSTVVLQWAVRVLHPPSVRPSQPLEAPSGTQKWMIKNSFQRTPKRPKVHRFALSNRSQRGGTGMKTWHLWFSTRQNHEFEPIMLTVIPISPAVGAPCRARLFLV